MAILVQKLPGSLFQPIRGKHRKTMVKNTWFDWKLSKLFENPWGLMKKKFQIFRLF